MNPYAYPNKHPLKSAVQNKVRLRLRFLQILLLSNPLLICLPTSFSLKQPPFSSLSLRPGPMSASAIAAALRGEGRKAATSGLDALMKEASYMWDIPFGYLIGKTWEITMFNR